MANGSIPAIGCYVIIHLRCKLCSKSMFRTRWAKKRVFGRWQFRPSSAVRLLVESRFKLPLRYRAAYATTNGNSLHAVTCLFATDTYSKAARHSLSRKKDRHLLGVRFGETDSFGRSAPRLRHDNSTDLGDKLRARWPMISSSQVGPQYFELFTSKHTRCEAIQTHFFVEKPRPVI